MADSFNGLSLNVTLQGVGQHEPVAYHVHKLPGGNNYYIDIGGNQPIERKVHLLFTSNTDAATFEGYRGTYGTLILTIPGTLGTALLTDTNRTQEWPNGWVEMDATFLI